MVGAVGRVTSDDDLERVAARWWPPAETAWLGPWLLRAAGGFTMRANSVAVLGSAPPDDAPALIDRTESWYRERGLPPRFALVDAPRTAAVRDALAGRGYVAAHGALHVHVMVRERLDVAGDDADVVHASDLDEPWVQRWWSVSPRGELLADGRALLERMPSPRTFARTGQQPLPAATGLAAVVDGWAGIGAIAVVPKARRRGLGRALTVGLLRWARGAGADRAFLQVSSNNHGAIALYRQLGFEIAYDYRYWQRPE